MAEDLLSIGKRENAIMGNKNVNPTINEIVN